MHMKRRETESHGKAEAKEMSWQCTSGTVLHPDIMRTKESKIGCHKKFIPITVVNLVHTIHQNTHMPSNIRSWKSTGNLLSHCVRANIVTRSHGLAHPFENCGQTLFVTCEEHYASCSESQVHSLTLWTAVLVCPPFFHCARYI